MSKNSHPCYQPQVGAAVTTFSCFERLMDPALGVPFTWPDLGESACSQPGTRPQPPLGSPVFPVLGQIGIWAALDVSLTFLAWGEGKVGGLLSTSSALSLQPITQQAPHERC